MSEPIVTPQAMDDILAIWQHLSTEGTSLADKWLSAVEEAIARLGRYPWMGHPRPELERLELRFFTLASPTKTTVIYRAGVPVYVLRVAGKGRDLGFLLGQGPRRP